MKTLIKPRKLEEGDIIVTVSPSNGWAGDSSIKWKYDLGVSKLEELGLSVLPAPNSLRGSDYLAKNPEARAEDIMWAFDNRSVSAIIANVGGNDSIKLIPYIDSKVISDNPKIFVGYSDIMNIHLLCYHCGLSSFYGDNLLTSIGDQAGWNDYSRKWFIKTLFDPVALGIIEPSSEWSFDPVDYVDPEKKRHYYPSCGYQIIQGNGLVKGRLIGGHTGILDLEGTSIELKAEDYEAAILFVEDIPEFFDVENIRSFFERLGEKGILQRLQGVAIGKTNDNTSFLSRARIIRQVVSERYSCTIPIIYGLNFGHSTPSFLLPYGALAEIDCDNNTFSILESGVTESLFGERV